MSARFAAVAARRAASSANFAATNRGFVNISMDRAQISTHFAAIRPYFVATTIQCAAISIDPGRSSIAWAPAISRFRAAIRFCARLARCTPRISLRGRVEVAIFQAGLFGLEGASTIRFAGRAPGFPNRIISSGHDRNPGSGPRART